MVPSADADMPIPGKYLPEQNMTAKSVIQGQVRRSERTGHRHSPPSQAASIAARVAVEREQLFKAIAIADLCRLAADSLLESGNPEHMISAMEMIGDLLNESAEGLEWISAELQKTSRKNKA